MIESSYAENHCAHCRFDHWVEDVEDPGDKEHGTYICLSSETMCIEGDSVEWMYVLSRCMRAAEGRECGMFQRKSWIKWFNPKPKMPFKISMFGRPLIRSDKMTVQVFSSSLVQELRIFLGEEGLSFFRELKEEHDTVSPILTIELGDGVEGENGAEKRRIPYPVHFYEEMQIRNWMRKQKETADKGDHYYDDNWMPLIEMAIG